MSNVNLLKSLPQKSGCYLFIDRTGDIIYVGKALNLKSRVSSYFRRDISDIKTEKLTKEIVDIDYIITDNELEALLLEAQLIRHHRPKYNIRLKDGNHYAYLHFSQDFLPRLETARIIKKGEIAFGPYIESETRLNLLKLANKLFKLRVSKVKPKKIGNKFLIRLSTHPWMREVGENEYKDDIAKTKIFLAGKNNLLIKKLKEEMKDYSLGQNYELAKLRRDQIKALENLTERQKIHLSLPYNQDFINYLIVANKLFVQLFNVDKGVVSHRQSFDIKLSNLQEPDKFISDFITQYYFSQEIPNELVIPKKITDQSLIQKYLTKKSDRRVIITVPEKGLKLELLKMLEKNLIYKLNTKEAPLYELKSILNLPALPNVIECFDISNLGANEMVGSMVYFKNGEPDKNNYRRFKIKTVHGQSDFAAMKEVIYRRYFRLKSEHLELPNLVIVDGGLPQLSAAQAVFRNLKINIPLIALAKKEELIYLAGKSLPLRLPEKSAALRLVQTIRNEAHRFAIKYHRLLRDNNFKKTLA